MLYTSVQGHQPVGYVDKKFHRLLSYLDVAVILAMRPLNNILPQALKAVY